MKKRGKQTVVSEKQKRAVVALLQRLGLLANNPSANDEAPPTAVLLRDAIACGLDEPRIIEVLPAAVAHHGQYFRGARPPWLTAIIDGCYEQETILGVRAADCRRWLETPSAQAYFDSW